MSSRLIGVSYHLAGEAPTVPQAEGPVYELTIPWELEEANQDFKRFAVHGFSAETSRHEQVEGDPTFQAHDNNFLLRRMRKAEVKELRSQKSYQTIGGLMVQHLTVANHQVRELLADEA